MAKEVAKAKIVQIVFVTKGIYDLEETCNNRMSNDSTR